MIKPKFIVVTTIATAAILVFSSTGILQNVAFAHQYFTFVHGNALVMNILVCCPVEIYSL
jgi:hypothetical protein